MPKESGTINGGMLQRQGPVQSVVITLNVDDLDASAIKIEEAGGELLGEKKEVGDMGWAAYFRDSEGNTFGLWQYKPQD